jgi:ABC-type transport system involved in multi-copper enzyme maturation permease subunit
VTPPWLRRVADGTRARCSFPLLAKELTETAARRRTYVLRVVYALGLYGVFALNLPNQTWTPDEHYSMLGAGKRMFETLTLLQFFGVALFLPALMCGRITLEKERDSLVLLFLTELRPWSIVLQKYVGGLVPMLSFLLLGLPLAGVAYAFGGLDSGEVSRMLFSLLLLALQIGALALLCSAWCRSTVGAFLATYFLGAALYIGPPVIANFLGNFISPDWLGNERWELQRYAELLFPPIAMVIDLGARTPSRALLVAPSIISIVFFLAMARRYLVQRAFVAHSNFLRRIFEWIDRLMKRANRVTGGILVWRDSKSLPGDAPIFWRETQRRVLGKPHYLIRLLYLVEIPTVFMCVLALFDRTSYWSQAEGFTMLATVLAILGALLLSVQAANSLVSERVGQTLEVLLTTPMGAREIVRQKERALRRLQLVVAIPLLTVFACEAHLEEGWVRRPTDGWLPYIVCAVLLVAIYLPMITWLSLWIGLRVRTRFQAIISAVATLTLWTALAPLLFYLLERSTHRWLELSPWRVALLLSPASVASLNESSELHKYAGGSPWPVVIANSALYLAITLLIRWRLFADAERCLRR